MRNSKVQVLTIAALLCALGILIPMIAPKFIMEPVSFTLASHVPVFIAMFISPTVAVSVALISAIGFAVSGFPPIIVARALTHMIFACIGAYILYKNKTLFHNKVMLVLFVLGVSIIHGLCEVLVVTPFYASNGMAEDFYQGGFAITIMGLVGGGTVIHSIVDFCIAYVIWRPISKVVSIPVSFRFKSSK